MGAAASTASPTALVTDPRLLADETFDYIIIGAGMLTRDSIIRV